MTKAIVRQRNCIYCGDVVKKVRRGEHIVPETIGGTVTISDVSDNTVCSKCNNEVLSTLDRELCSRSYLSIIASQEIDAHLWQAWEVDTTAGNVLLEARPSWEGNELKTLICYPQMTFERQGPELRGDLNEIEQFGLENFEKVLTRAARIAFRRYNRGEKRVLHFERIESSIRSEGYRFPPRIFTRHSIAEIARKIDRQSFIVRYCTSDDKHLALRWLSRLDNTPSFNKWREKVGTLLPAMGQFFDIGLTLRALFKIGINLLAAYCRKTSVNHQTFSKAINVVRGTAGIHESLITANGFVHAIDLAELQATGNGHAFRLVYHDGHWLVYSSFFGGRINAVVAIPGPNYEEWNTMEIVMPLNDKDLSVSTYSVIQPIKVHIEWRDITKIAPSLKLQNEVSKVIVESMTRT